jgi:hypothetical protein
MEHAPNFRSSDVSYLQDQLLFLWNENLKLSQKLNRPKSSQTPIPDSMTELIATIVLLEVENETLKKLVKKHEDRIVSLESDVTTLQSDNKTLKNDNKTLKSDVTILKNESLKKKQELDSHIGVIYVRQVVKVLEKRILDLLDITEVFSFKKACIAAFPLPYQEKGGFYIFSSAEYIKFKKILRDTFTECEDDNEKVKEFSFELSQFIIVNSEVGNDLSHPQVEGEYDLKYLKNIEGIVNGPVPWPKLVDIVDILGKKLHHPGILQLPISKKRMRTSNS